MENKLKILVIEDEKNILNFIGKNLELSGYRVLKALTGEEGLLVALSQNPDVILLDLGLPDMDGTQVIREIRKESDTPIIVLSARTDEADKVEALDHFTMSGAGTNAWREHNPRRAETSSATRTI